MITDLDRLKAEYARRELAKRSFREYLAYVGGKQWKRTRMSTYLADEVQRFIEEDTGNAYDILVIETPPQHGKLCADSTPVPTPFGWKKHGEIHTGDYVFSPDGKPIRVLAEIPQEEPASMLVRFSDGAEVKVHPNHEWVVHSRRSKFRSRSITIETHTMLENGLHIGPEGRGGRFIYSVDHNVGVEYPISEQPVDPYMFGLWLGDGSTTKPCITHHPLDTESIEKCVSRGYAISTVCKHATTGCLTTYFSSTPLVSGLHSLGLGSRVSNRKKYIPACYKIASKEQRLELLAGMIDSDGYVYRRNGRVTISNVNKELIDDLAEVVRSLGWTATISAAEPMVSTSGVIGRKVCYQLTFNPDCVIPTALPRKRITKINPTKRRRAIVSIEPCASEHGKCITVEGGVYLVGDYFTPTHNSSTVTEALPSWVLGRYPEWRVILGSYNEETAERFTRRNREKVTSYGDKIFGIRIGKINRATEFELDGHLGRLISRGVMGGVTGNPANLMLIDDAIKNRQDADSDSTRGKLWDEWLNSFKTRLAAKAKVVVIGTPWREDDYLASILRTEPTARLIRLPVEAEENDPLGRGVGEALCPEIGKDNAWLAQFKAGYINDPEGGLRAWTALYQCSPRVEGGNILHRDWWRYYDATAEENQYFPIEVISVDAAFKDSEKNDFVAISVVGKRGTDVYVEYVLNKHLDFTETCNAIRQIKRLYPRASRVLIEDKANGSAIINVLQREMFCIPVNPKGGKVSRVNAVSAAVESGHVFLPKDAAWVGEFLDQATAFPAAAHDDMIDAFTQACAYLLFTNGATEIETDEDRQSRLLEEEASVVFLNSDMYSVYDRPEDDIYVV